MNLIDRFIDFNDWTTSRKTVLLMAVALLFHVVVTPIMYFYLQRTQIVDSESFAHLMLGGFVAVFICMGLALQPALANSEGRWTGYAMSMIYGYWLVWMFVGFGLWSSAIVASWPLVIVLLVMWYDLRLATFAMVHFLVVLLALVTLTRQAVLPYAYLLLDRNVDLQSSLDWSIGMMVPYLAFFLFAFVLAALTLTARKRQDSKLLQAQALIRRYLPTHLAERIEAGEHEAGARPVRSKLTIFFSDIVGFTQASDELDPEELADVLNEYMSEMAEIAEAHGASVNQMAGDGLMLLFGAPLFTNDQDHALRAVRMALAMQQRLRELKSRWLQHGLHAPIEARMGINTGYVSIGDFGSAGRKIYTAIGMQANVAARIQAQCEPGKVLISESTWALVKDEVRCEARGELALKGVHYSVPTFELRDEIEGRPERATVTLIHSKG